MKSSRDRKKRLSCWWIPDTSKENVIRAAESQACRVMDVAPEGEGYRIILAKG